MNTWLITGCSTGLGRSLAQAVLKRGYHAVVTARDVEKVKEFQQDFPETALILPLDVTDDTSIQQAVRAAKERFGEIDVLVNNAGYGYRAAVEEGESSDTARLFDTNFWGPIALIKEVLPDMRAKRSGAIINVSSIAALRTAPGSGYYAASKCALEGMSEGLRIETAPLGIKVMTVEPGAFRTDFAGRSLTQSGIVIEDYAETAGTRRIGKDTSHGTQPGDPDKGAELIIKAIETEDTPFRLLLGSDAVKFADDVLESRRNEYDKWREFSCKSDF
ncbi:MAG: SDR family NAD(P)-dependent oxidoreductase [Lachnospiraceae bacterium]|nr:SDR family NAD(P)-dependent oxidoreductase [Lachnospiraceae bacterium]